MFLTFQFLTLSIKRSISFKNVASALLIYHHSAHANMTGHFLKCSWDIGISRRWAQRTILSRIPLKALSYILKWLKDFMDAYEKVFAVQKSGLFVVRSTAAFQSLAAMRWAVFVRAIVCTYGGFESQYLYVYSLNFAAVKILGPACSTLRKPILHTHSSMSVFYILNCWDSLCILLLKCDLWHTILMSTPNITQPLVQSAHKLE